MLRWFLVVALTVAALIGGVFGYVYAGCWDADASCPWWGEASAVLAYFASGALLIEVGLAFIWLFGTATDAMAAVVRRLRKD